MQVRLLKDVEQSGVVKVSASRRRGAVAWYAGAVIDMSDASAKKYIEAGLAEPANAPADEVTA